METTKPPISDAKVKRMIAREQDKVKKMRSEPAVVDAKKFADAERENCLPVVGNTLQLIGRPGTDAVLVTFRTKRGRVVYHATAEELRSKLTALESGKSTAIKSEG